MNSCQNTPPEAIQLVVARLETQPPNLMFASGADGHSYTRDELIKQVETCSPVGLAYIQTDLDYLKAMASGELLRVISQ